MRPKSLFVLLATCVLFFAAAFLGLDSQDQDSRLGQDGAGRSTADEQRHTHKWDDLAIRDRAGAEFAKASAIWREQLSTTISSVLPALTAVDFVITPFSGADIFSGIAVGPNAEEYVLLCENPALPMKSWDEWKNSPKNNKDPTLWCEVCRNDTNLAPIRTLAGELLEESAGGAFQWGIKLRQFAAKYGMLPLLLAGFGTLRASILVKDAVLFTSGKLKGVLFTCSRKGKGSDFRVRYTEAHLHDGETISELGLQLKAWAGTGKTALTFVKAAEVGLQTQNKTSINNPNLSQEKIQDLLRKYAEQDRGKEAVSDLLLSVSDYVVQDSTGFDAQRLEQFAAPGVVETFGAYNHRDEGARARATQAIFDRNVGTAHMHPIGSMAIGYCITVPLSPEQITAMHAQNPSLQPAQLPPAPPGKPWSALVSLPASPPLCHLMAACRGGCQLAAQISSSV